MTPFDPLVALRLQRGAEHLHRCGARAMAEFLAELVRRGGCLPLILMLLAEYQARLNPRLLRAAGGDRFPPRPLCEAPR